MAVIEKHVPGTFCWAELGTTDTSGAKRFYTGIFGWSPDDMPMGENQVYTMLKIDGREMGALYELNPEQRGQGVPPHWMLYVAVESADSAAAKAKQLGATVLAGPFDVFDAGRMAVIRDPQGATFSVWQARTHSGSKIGQVAGTLCWSELATTDPAAATHFYTGLFGWGTKVSDMGPVRYTEWLNQGQPTGGMMQMPEQWKEAPPHWMPYFQVEDCDGSAAKARELGGKILHGPEDIPNVGRFAVIRDPQGAVFSIIRLNTPAPA